MFVEMATVAEFPDDVGGGLVVVKAVVVLVVLGQVGGAVCVEVDNTLEEKMCRVSYMMHGEMKLVARNINRTKF